VFTAGLVTATGRGGGPDAALALYLARSDPMMVLRDLLGHSSVVTTEAYLNRLDMTRVYSHAYERASRDAGLISAERGADGGAARLSRGLLAEYWMQAGAVHESLTRRMLVSFDSAGGGGGLQEGARALADGRQFKARPPRSPLVSYTEEEWGRLRQACRDDVDRSFARHEKQTRRNPSTRSTPAPRNPHGLASRRRAPANPVECALAGCEHTDP
jgi:hypothetical protein